MSNINALTEKRLRELVSYDVETGLFTSLKNRGPIKKGQIVGTLNLSGYRQIQIDGVIYYGHRLAFLYMTGQWPTTHIDHINGRPGDDRYVNLRDVSQSGNAQNQRVARKDNKRGLLGTSLHSQTGKWVSRIKIGKLYKHLGCFDTAEQAHSAYIAAKRIHHSTCSI